MLATLLVTIISIGLSTLALHWASQYAEADESSYAKCLILSVVWQVVVVIVNSFFTGGDYFINFIIYSVINIVICVKVLKIPGENFFTFIIILTFLSLILQWGAKLVLNGMI